MLRLCKALESEIVQVIVQITDVLVVGFQFQLTPYLYNVHKEFKPYNDGTRWRVQLLRVPFGAKSTYL